MTIRTLTTVAAGGTFLLLAAHSYQLAQRVDEQQAEIDRLGTRLRALGIIRDIFDAAQRPKLRVVSQHVK